MKHAHDFKFSKGLKKSIRKIVVLDTNLPSKERVIYEKSYKKKKKEISGLKGIEKIARRIAKANQTYTDEYLRRHDRSRGKKKSGWLKEMGENVYSARRKALKKL